MVLKTDSGSGSLELFDSNGNPIALGTPGAANYDQGILDFLVPVTGTYIVEVTTSDYYSTYNLVVTEGMTFDTQSDNTQATAQDITASGGGVLGAILPSNSSVLYYSDYNTQGIYTQAFANLGITPTVVYSYYDFENELASGNWGLVILDDNDYFDTSWQTPLQNYVEAGGHAIMDSWIGPYSYDDAVAAAFGAAYTGAIDDSPIYQTVASPIWNGIGNPYSLGNPDFFGIWSTGLTATTGVSIGQFANTGDAAIVVGNNGNTILNGFQEDSVSNTSQAILLAENEIEAVIPAAAPLSNYYSVDTNAGDILNISVTLPSQGSGQFTDSLSPVLDLFDPNGNLVASGTSITYTIPSGDAGLYAIEVSSASDSTGEYALSVSGETGGLAPVTVTSVTPPDGALLQPPSSITVTFSQPINLSTLSASELTVTDTTTPSEGTMTAYAYYVDNSEEVTWYLPSSFYGNSENNLLQIEGGVIQDLSGTAVAAFSENYTTDNVAPSLVGASVNGSPLTEGELLTSGDLTFTLTFSEPMENQYYLSPASFDLHGNYLNSDYTPVSYSFDPTGTILTLSYVNLPGDDYTLTLFSLDATDSSGVTNYSGFEDLVGNAFDGEPNGSGLVPSGDGIAGGNFYVDFGIPAGTTGLTLTPINPLGGLIYQGSTTTVLVTPTDVDTFTLNLNSGQTITIADTSTTLQPVVELFDPNGNLVDSAAASAPGAPVILQTLPVSLSGTYSILVYDANGNEGLVTTQVTLNAALNDGNTGSMATAQDLTGSFVGLGVHGASRGAVLGSFSDLSEGDVFVSQRGYPGVMVLDSNGDVIGQFTDPSLSAGVVQYIRLGVDNTVYVGLDTDPGTGYGGELLHFTASGTLLNIIYLYPAYQGDYYYYPFGFDVAPDASLWVADPYNGYVEHLTPSGSLIEDYYVGGTPEDVAVQQSTGLIFVSNYGYGTIQELDPTSGYVTTFGYTYYGSPYGLHFAPDGDLVVADVDYGIEVFDSYGGYPVQSIYDPGVTDASVDPSGNYWATNVEYSTVDVFDQYGDYLGGVYASEPLALAIVGTDSPPPSALDNSDWYSFTVGAGQSATIAVTSLNGSPLGLTLQDSYGDILATGATVDTNVSDVISNYVPGVAGTYYVNVTGNSGAYSLVVTLSADFSVNPNGDESTAQPLGGPVTGELGAITSSTPSGVYYSEYLPVGATISLTISTPIGQSGGQFVDSLQPNVELVDPNGIPVAMADGNGSSLTYTVQPGEGGTFYAIVTGDYGSQGEFYLDDPVTLPAGMTLSSPLVGTAEPTIAPAMGSLEMAALGDQGGSETANLNNLAGIGLTQIGSLARFQAPGSVSASISTSASTRDGQSVYTSVTNFTSFGLSGGQNLATMSARGSVGNDLSGTETADATLGFSMVEQQSKADNRDVDSASVAGQAASLAQGAARIVFSKVGAEVVHGPTTISWSGVVANSLETELQLGGGMVVNKAYSVKGENSWNPDVFSAAVADLGSNGSSAGEFLAVNGGQETSGNTAADAFWTSKNPAVLSAAMAALAVNAFHVAPTTERVDRKRGRFMS